MQQKDVWFSILKTEKKKTILKEEITLSRKHQYNVLKFSKTVIKNSFKKQEPNRPKVSHSFFFFTNQT